MEQIPGRVVDANRRLEFDCDRHLRFLARKHFLEAVKGKDGKISGWKRSAIWPPPPEFFKIRPIGFAHFIQTWFRYYVQQWIEKRQSELETKEGVYSYGLRGGLVPVGYRLRAGNIDGTFLREESEEVAQPHGRRGLHASAPPLSANELADQELDVGKLNIEWVDHTEDLFSGILAGITLLTRSLTFNPAALVQSSDYLSRKTSYDE
jgi:hypothetical protein